MKTTLVYLPNCTINMDRIFELTLDEERDEHNILIGVIFKFTCANYVYAVFNPYHATGTVGDWNRLIDATANPKNYRTSVKIDGEKESSRDYTISVGSGGVVFSTDYDCTGYQPAVDISIPAYACLPAFKRMRQLVKDQE